MIGKFKNDTLQNLAQFLFLLITFVSFKACAEADRQLTHSQINNNQEPLSKKFETQFFNFLMTKDDWSKQIRDQAIHDMSDQGFAAAKLYLDYREAKLSKDSEKVNSVLESLIKSDDFSVQCLLSTHLDILNNQGQKNGDVWKQKIISSAKNGVAHCLYWSAAFQTNPSEKILLITRAAKAGDLFSQYELYKKYKDGDGVDKNLDAAFCWALKTQESAKQVWNNSLSNVSREARFLYIKELRTDPYQRDNNKHCQAYLN